APAALEPLARQRFQDAGLSPDAVTARAEPLRPIVGPQVQGGQEHGAHHGDQSSLRQAPENAWPKDLLPEHCNLRHLPRSSGYHRAASGGPCYSPFHSMERKAVTRTGRVALSGEPPPMEQTRLCPRGCLWRLWIAPATSILGFEELARCHSAGCCQRRR